MEGKRTLYFYFFTIILSILFIINPSQAQHDIISRLEDAYKNIRDATGSFVQISYIKDLDKTQKFNGNFFIKGENLRWQYSGEFSQIIYINKENLIVYDKKRKQAIKSNFNSEKYGQLPLALLSRMVVLERDFDIIQKSESDLTLIPKEKMGNIRKIELVIHEEAFPIKKIKVTDVSGNIIKIDFNSIKVNTNLKDSLFKFIPQKDDTVITY